MVVLGYIYRTVLLVFVMVALVSTTELIPKFLPGAIALAMIYGYWRKYDDDTKGASQ